MVDALYALDGQKIIKITEHTKQVTRQKSIAIYNCIDIILITITIINGCFSPFL